MKSDQDLYRRLRELPKEVLWNAEAARFDAASPRERMDRVAVIRAVGMLFSRFGSEEEKSTVREWLITLLRDPQEKIRRYAIAALPKIGPGAGGESRMLELLKEAGEEREQRHLGRALEKIGGAATLAALEETEGLNLPAITRQKVKAAVSRVENPSEVRLDARIRPDAGLQVLLHCRKGLEEFVREEAVELLSGNEWRIESVKPGLVTLQPLKDFSLATLYRMRCFATIGFPLGNVSGVSGPAWIETLARCIASLRTQSLMRDTTRGAARYRLEFAGRGHQRGAIRQVIERAYELCPGILNDARQAPWSIDVIASGGGMSSVELRPRLYPDPRLRYRQDDIAAASHPPLAACMARLAGLKESEVIWDPFCGSGLELIERSLRGGVTTAYGTDLDSKALDVARVKFASARLAPTRAEFIRSDFRDAGQSAGIAPGSISLVITNPPLGRRIRIKDMQGLFIDLYAESARALGIGGRLIFVNPLRTVPGDPSLRLEYQKTIDLGGFNCRLEMYRKVLPGNGTKSSTKLQPGAVHEASTSSRKPDPAWWSRVGRTRRS